MLPRVFDLFAQAEVPLDQVGEARELRFLELGGEVARIGALRRDDFLVRLLALVRGQPELLSVRAPDDERQREAAGVIRDLEVPARGQRRQSLDATVVQPREVFREATAVSAAAIVLFHNHPSGDPEPSADDVVLTRRLVAAGIGILVLQHEPVAALRRAHEAESPAELHPEELDLEAPARQLRVERLGLRRAVPAAVPHDHLTGAVVAARDHALEIRILDGMILDVDGEPPLFVTVGTDPAVINEPGISNLPGTLADVSHGGIADLEIMTEEYSDRELDREPETYLGVTEVARELHVSRQRVSELRRSDAFPAPIAELLLGHVPVLVGKDRGVDRPDSTALGRLPERCDARGALAPDRRVAHGHREEPRAGPPAQPRGLSDARYPQALWQVGA